MISCCFHGLVWRALRNRERPSRRASAGFMLMLAGASFLAAPAAPGSTIRAGVTLTVEEQYGGSASAIALQGDLAFLGMGPRLTIIDLSDPTSPKLVGRSTPLAGVIEHLVASDGLVYASGVLGAELSLGEPGPPSLPERNIYGLRVFDGRDPSRVALRGFWPAVAPVEGLAVEGHRIFLAMGDAGLHILDVSDADDPHEIGSLPKGSSLGHAQDVVARAGIAYVADDANHRLLVVDAVDGAAPFLVSSLDTHLAPIALELVYPALLMGMRRNGPEAEVAAVDVSQADRPILAARPTVDVASVVDIVAAGDRAYFMADAPYCILDGVRALDISNPLSPQPLGYEFLTATVGALAASEDLLVMAAGEMGLRVLDAATPQTIAQVGYAGNVSTAMRVSDPSTILVANGGCSGLDQIPGEDASALLPIGRWRMEGFASPSLNDVEVVGETAYVAFGQNCLRYRAGLLAFDLAGAPAPIVIGEVDLRTPHRPGDSSALALEGSFAYVSDEFGWLSVVDVSQPVTPTRVGLLDHQELGEQFSELIDVAVEGGLAYVVVREPTDTSVDIIDVEANEGPHRIARIEPLGQAWSVDAYGRRVYIADARYGVHVWDTSDPSHSRYLGGNTSLNAINWS